MFVGGECSDGRRSVKVACPNKSGAYRKKFKVSLGTCALDCEEATTIQSLKLLDRAYCANRPP